MWCGYGGRVCCNYLWEIDGRGMLSVVELGMDYIIRMMLVRTTLRLQSHFNMLKENHV